MLEMKQTARENPLHTGSLGPFHGCMFLLIVDARSKWPEFFNIKMLKLII